MTSDIFVHFIFLTTLFGAARQMYKVIRRKSYRDSFCVVGGGGGGGDKGGGGGGYSPPAPPDPMATAAAQGGQDRMTAQTNALVLNPNVNTPYGSISYDVNSYNADPSNKTVNRPTQTINLSPDQTQLLGYKNQIGQTLGNLGVNYANQFAENPIVAPRTPGIPTKIDYSNVSAVPTMDDYQNAANTSSKAYYDQAYNLMQPAMDQQRNLLQNQLVQSGNPLNSEDYNTQMGNFQRNQDQALSSLANQAVGQGYNIQNQLFNNANTTRAAQISAAQLPYQTAQTMQANDINQQSQIQNQNINALSALLQGQQAIQMPASPGYNQAALSSPNFGQYQQNAYQSQLNNYNQAYQQQQQQGSSAMSGLFSLGSALAGFF